jgi:hypothetical protein
MIECVDAKISLCVCISNLWLSYFLFATHSLVYPLTYNRNKWAKENICTFFLPSQTRLVLMSVFPLSYMECVFLREIGMIMQKTIKNSQNGTFSKLFFLPLSQKVLYITYSIWKGRQVGKEKCMLLWKSQILWWFPFKNKISFIYEICGGRKQQSR